MAAVRWIFDNLILSNKSPWVAIFHHCTKFGETMLIDAEIMAQNRNPRWQPSAILDLLHHHIGPPTKTYHWATSAGQILC